MFLYKTIARARRPRLGITPDRVFNRRIQCTVRLPARFWDGGFRGPQGQRDYLANQVDLAPLSVSVIQNTDAAPTSESFWDGLSQGWQSVINVGSVLVVAFGFLLPWLAIMAGTALVAVAVIWLSVRATRSRRGAVPPSESSDSSQN